jgi:uncharacterized protein DUF4340
MKSRNLIILFVVVAALGAVQLMQKMSHNRATSASDTQPVLGVSFDPQDINRVVLGFGPDSTAVVLEKLPDSWVARSAWSHPADAAKVNSLLDELVGLRGEFRSDSPDVLADYGLGAENDQVTVAVFGQEWEKVFDLSIGNKAERGTGNFMHRPDSDTVFLSRANLMGKMGLYSGPALPETRHFLDLKVYQCSNQDIRAITLFMGDDEVSMEKVFEDPPPVVDENGVEIPGETDHSVWEWVLTTPESRPLAKTKVDAIASAVNNVIALDVDDPRINLQQYGLWRAANRIVVDMLDGSEFEMRFGDLREATDGKLAGNWMMTSLDRTIWVMNETKSKQLFKPVDELLPELPEEES